MKSAGMNIFTEYSKVPKQAKLIDGIRGQDNTTLEAGAERGF